VSPAPIKDREGVIVIRVWTDGGTPHLPRARITTVRDLARGEPVSAAAAGVDSIATAIRDWLKDFVSA
jgi:hypothetical protein